MAPVKILVTGATGYIGGTFVNHIASSTTLSLGSAEYFVLLRSAAQASLFASLAVKPVVLQNADDLEELRRVASDYDVIVNMAYISLPDHAKALLLGLSDRKKTNPQARAPVFIQATSGTSNLADKPFTQPNRVEQLGLPKEYTDRNPEEIYEAEKKLEAEEAYPLRTTELTVIVTGLELGVKTHVVMVPTVFGVGTGPGNKQSIQIPLLIRSVLKNGYLAVADHGMQEWDRVHVTDLVGLLGILLDRVLQGKEVRSGKQGIVFAGSSRSSWRTLAQSILDAGIKLGKIPDSTGIKHVDFEKAATDWGLGGAMGLAELGFASNSRTTAEKAFEWGWKPKVLNIGKAIEEDWIAITADK